MFQRKLAFDEQIIHFRLYQKKWSVIKLEEKSIYKPPF
jgi:hypothetical protein